MSHCHFFYDFYYLQGIPGIRGQMGFPGPNVRAHDYLQKIPLVKKLLNETIHSLQGNRGPDGDKGEQGPKGDKVGSIDFNDNSVVQILFKIMEWN